MKLKNSSEDTTKEELIIQKEEIELESTQSNTTAKIPLLKLVAETTTNDVGTLTTIIPGPVTTEEKAKKKNDVKARIWRYKSDLDTMSLMTSTTTLRLLNKRVPRNQENKTRNQETTRRTMNIEDTSSKAMVAIDEAGFDWSYMADDEAPTNMDVMALSDSKKTLVHHLLRTGNQMKSMRLISPPEKKRKNVKPNENKIELEIPKQNEKPARRPVKYAEIYK
nr:hypothetical protein [Tanacetum cinerariifolium]